MTRKFSALLAALVALALILAGCSAAASSDETQRQQQEQILQEGTRQVGMPDIKNFFERKTLKAILEMRDDPKLTTYAYTQGLSGKMIYLGRAVGYGIPYATQYTNPQKYGGGSYGYFTLPQADPNGLFSPGSAEATWVLLVNEQTNEPEVMYLEPKLTITQSKLPRRLVEEWSLTPNY